MRNSILQRKRLPEKKERHPSSCSFRLWLFCSLFITILTNPLIAQTPDSWNNGQCAVNCNNHLNITLNEDGEALIEPLLVWEGGGGDACWSYLDSVKVIVDGAIHITEVSDGTGNVFGGITGSGVTFTSALLNCSHVGGNIDYNLEFYFNDGTQNNCWGTLLIEDKQAPIMACSDTLIYCNQDAAVENIGGPIVTDNCDADISLTHTDVFTDLECDTPFGNTLITGKIERSWTATDDYGNQTTCLQVIYFEKATLDDVTIPDEIELSCEQDPNNLELAGQPTINGSTINAGDLCNIGVTYTDQEYPLCGNSRKVVRTWVLVDWCPYGTIGTTTEAYVQIITLADTTGPSFTCPEDMTANANQGLCGAVVLLPAVDIADNCSDYTLEIVTPVGTITENGGLTPDALDLGTHTITYIVTDACGNTTSCTLNVTVVDEVNPVAVCDEHTVLALSSGGGGQLCWETLDDGSYDNCEITSYSIQRVDAPTTAFAECLSFDCSDAGQSIEIILKVTDIAGNENTCIVIVDVQDKVDPIVSCPSNITLECSEDYTDLSVTGEATADDNCGLPNINYTDSLALNSCGTGEVFRRWTATDVQGTIASCMQTITIINSDPFVFEDITFPIDFEVGTCGAALDPENLPVEAAWPIVTEDACDQVAITYADDTLSVVGTACLKVLRVWTIVDWCQYEPNQTIPAGRWDHTQVIKIFNSEAPVILSDCADIDVCAYEEDCGDVSVALGIDASDDCSSAADLNYHYTIDLHTDGNDDLLGNTNDATGIYPLGTHTIYWEVEDGCGNITTCNYRFKISDCKKPSPICINGLAAEIMPTSAAITLWATDFESGSSFDNCTPHEALIFSFSADTSDTNITFTCDHIGIQNLKLWATDADGNQDFCSTYVIVQDNQFTCPDSGTELASISGTVETENQDMVENVTVAIGGSNDDPIVTGANGAFSFTELPTGANYTVTPSKNMNHGNGVTTFDLVLITKHILGITLLNSPYKIIAADANRSNTVTTLDMVKLRRLILNIDTNLSDGESWRFVDKDFVFPDMTNPFATIFPEVYSINDMESDEFASFVGVKIGDVNNSALVNSLMEASAGRNKQGELIFAIADQKVKANETITVDFAAENFEDIAAFQFTLNFDADALEFVDFTAGDLTEMSGDNFGFHQIENGIITCSWNDVKGIHVDKNVALFSLSFKANQKASLSNLLTINSSVTNAEAYTETVVKDIALAFTMDNGQALTGGLELLQNTPNPFDKATTIGFNLKNADQISLRILDLSGSVIKSYEGKYTSGYHEIQIDRDELPAVGMLYYQLKTSSETATRKMLLMN